MRALITGGTGMIGSALVKAASDRFDHLEVWDNRAPTLWTSGEQTRFVELDISKLDGIPSKKFDAVFHLAASTENVGSRVSYEADLGSMGVLLSLLDYLSRSPPDVLIYASTQLVYGPGPTLDESAVMEPMSRFAATKGAGELFVNQFALQTGSRVISCRLANVVDRNMRRGLIPDLVEKARRSGGELEILGDGSQVRSFVDSVDVAYALLIAAERSEWRTLNVANTSTTTVLEVAEAVAAFPDPPLRVRKGKGSAGWRGDPGTLIPNAARLLSLGWEPRLTSTQAALAAARGAWELRR